MCVQFSHNCWDISIVEVVFNIWRCLMFCLFAVHPLIQVPNQLVGAPTGTDVTLQCHVEASPKAINYWTRDTGKWCQSFTLRNTCINTKYVRYNITFQSSAELKMFTPQKWKFKIVSDPRLGPGIPVFPYRALSLSYSDASAFLWKCSLVFHSNVNQM